MALLALQTVGAAKGLDSGADSLALMHPDRGGWGQGWEQQWCWGRSGVPEILPSTGFPWK